MVRVMTNEVEISQELGPRFRVLSHKAFLVFPQSDGGRNPEREVIPFATVVALCSDSKNSWNVLKHASDGGLIQPPELSQHLDRVVRLKRRIRKNWQLCIRSGRAVIDVSEDAFDID